MAQKAQPFFLVHDCALDDPKNSLGLASDLVRAGWLAGPPVEGPSRKAGSPGVLMIHFRPDPAALETASERL